ncbi:MAG: HNH endonuclease [Anaerolineae bacterium]
MSSIPQVTRQRLMEQARYRCGYCQAQQQYLNLTLEIEHIQPQAKGGTDEETNLWIACRACNSHKGEQTHALDPITNRLIALFNPRLQNWHEHFTWSDDKTLIIGVTPCGRATIEALQMNHKLAVEVRGHWVHVGWHPPKD